MKKRPASTAERTIREIRRAYLAQASAMSCADLSSRQQAPWASVSFGAAGLGLALLRGGGGGGGGGGGRADRRASAERLLAGALRGAARRSALRGVDPTFATMDLRCSITFGRAGIELVQLLASPGAPDEALTRAFLRRCRSAHGHMSELTVGAAGALTGLVLLWRARPHPRRDARVLAAADALAADLLARGPGPRGWTRAEPLGFAHGRAGTFHALLGWSMAAGRSLPAWFDRELARLAKDVARGGLMGAPPSGAGRLERTWCNGAAGLTLLWARAYERSGDASHRRLAREAARFAMTRARGGDTGGDLCCGLGGRAYALLAMDRIEPDRGWDDHARDMTAEAFESMAETPGPWPNGLYRGFPGLVCLASDLARSRHARAGFPLVEG